MWHLQWHGIPEGNNGEGAIEDCAGVCAGNATIDECNQCDADPTNDNACFIQNCKHTWFGLCYDCPVGQFQDHVINMNANIVAMERTRK